MDIERLAIQSSQEHLIPFCIVMDPRYEVNWHHREIAHALERVESGECKRLIIEMPPRHGKSQLASIFFPTWYLGKNPDKEIITCSYSADLAQDFGSKARDVIQDTQYQTVFDTKLKADSKSKGKWHTQEKGSYTSVGIGGPITGRGANILLIDDPIKNREEAESEVYRQKVWDWYKSTAYTRLEQDGAVIVIMTRWHTDDLVGRLLEDMEMGKDQWERVRFQAISEESDEFRAQEEPLWPDKYSYDNLLDIKKTLGPYDWQALYQQNPIASETQEFQRAWFKYYKDEDLRNKDLYYYSVTDLAIGKGQQADETATILIAKEKDKPEIYIIDIYHGQLDPGQTIDYLFSLRAKYGSKFIRAGIESVAYQKALHYFVKEEQRKRETYFDVVELKASGAKELRIRGLIPMYAAGVIYHNQTCNELESQLMVFPVGRHDDMADALAYIPQILKATTRKTSERGYIPTHKGYLNR